MEEKWKCSWCGRKYSESEIKSEWALRGYCTCKYKE